MKADHGSIDLGTRRRRGRVRHVPIREEQQREQQVPVRTKYRPRGMPITVVPTNPRDRVQRDEPAMVP